MGRFHLDLASLKVTLTDTLSARVACWQHAAPEPRWAFPGCVGAAVRPGSSLSPALYLFLRHFPPTTAFILCNLPAGLCDAVTEGQYIWP